MTERLWTDDEFRSFIGLLRETTGFLSTRQLGEVERDAFLRQAALRVVPETRRRLLASIGVQTSATGVAAICLEAAEEATQGPEHTWLLASTAPWAYFTDLVAERILRSYRHAHGKPSRKALDGIEAASAHRAIEG